ncbi:MAG: hypothetical protein CMJ24_06045 [Phycisphaerae bacterium]|nr:hypothetical protein [Phycisphaerae bacterium]|tara:strand:- start:262 stop:1035 length:774 start_codon:yes stop_codon:yes gene_type:complete
MEPDTVPPTETTEEGVASTDDTTADAATSKGGSNLQFLAALIFLAFIVVIVILWVMTMMTPAWYAPPAADDAPAAELAQKAEFGLVENMQKIREPGATWKLRISDDAVNAWLATRMSKWLAHEGHPPWPEYLGIPQIHTTPSGIIMAIELASDGGASRILGLQIEPEIAIEGTMRLVIVGGLLGRLPVPAPPSSLLEMVRDAATDGDESSALAVQYLLDGVDFSSLMPLVDGRRVQIDQVQLENGSFVLVARTLPRS